MSATLNSLKHRLSQSTEYTENPGISIAREAIAHAEKLEQKLYEACGIIGYHVGSAS